MDLHHALRTRSTVHRYHPEPVPADVIDRALAAAHQAPNHKLTWPWRFTVVGPNTRARFLPVAEALKAKKGPLTETGRALIAEKLLNPALVVVSMRRCEATFQAREDYAATACAIQNIQLSVHADGFGAKWSSGGLTTAPPTYETLGIDPAVEEIVGFIWIGVPVERPTVSRPPVEDFVRRLD